MPFNAEKLAKLQATATSVRTGGKGSIRRKKKTVRKASVQDNAKLTSTLSRLNAQDIPAIEEVNLFKDDGNIIHFRNPKVKAAIGANTYAVTGNSETKKLQELMPGIISQIGPDNLEGLKKVYETYSQKGAGAGAAADDDEIPDLVDNFEDASRSTGKDDKDGKDGKDGKDTKENKDPKDPKDPKPAKQGQASQSKPAQPKSAQPKSTQAKPAPAPAPAKPAQPKSAQPKTAQPKTAESTSETAPKAKKSAGKPKN